MRSTLTPYRNAFFWLTLFFFSCLLLRITIQYIPINYDVAFLQIKQDYIHILHWRFAFFTHVFFSMFVLLAGLTQFSVYILKKYRSLHRLIGKIYVIDVLFITGPASFIMALYANGHLPSRIAFTTLSVLWMFFTAMAWRSILQKNVLLHKQFMYRSYALTLSAVTLRCWKYILVALFHPPPMTVYQIAAWLGFIPNLIFIEWWIRRKRFNLQVNNYPVSN